MDVLHGLAAGAHLLGDEGSGYAIVMDALRTVCRVADGRQPSGSLSDRLLRSMGLTDATQLISAVHGGAWDRTRLAGLARDVIQAADDGDAVAEEIVVCQARELAGCVAAVIKALGLRNGVPVALTGGLLTKAASYRARFVRRLADLAIEPSPLLVVPEPAEGAHSGWLRPRPNFDALPLKHTRPATLVAGLDLIAIAAFRLLPLEAAGPPTGAGPRAG